MALPKRFALSTLLLVSLVFGYAQWRRQWLVQEVKELNAIGSRGFSFHDATRRLPTFSTIELTDGWWPTVKPQAVQVNVNFDDFGRTVSIGGMRYPVGSAPGVVADLRLRLLAVGIADVTVYVQGAIQNYEAAKKVQGVR